MFTFNYMCMSMPVLCVWVPSKAIRVWTQTHPPKLEYRFVKLPDVNVGN